MSAAGEEAERHLNRLMAKVEGPGKKGLNNRDEVRWDGFVALLQPVATNTHCEPFVLRGIAFVAAKLHFPERLVSASR